MLRLKSNEILMDYGIARVGLFAASIIILFLALSLLSAQMNALGGNVNPISLHSPQISFSSSPPKIKLSISGNKSYGNVINIIVNIPNTSDYVGIKISNNGYDFVVPLNRPMAAYSGLLPVGKYTVIAFSNSSGIKDITKPLKIKQAKPKVSCTHTPKSSFDYNGTPFHLTCNVSTIDNQLNYNLYIKYTSKNGGKPWDKYIGNTNTSISYSNASAGKYTWTFNTTRNQNYSTTKKAGHLTGYLSIKPGIAMELNGAMDKRQQMVYGTPSNFSASISPSTDFISIYINGTLMAGPRRGNVTYSTLLGAGMYKITAATNASHIINVSYFENVSKATPTITLTATRGNFTYNGTTENISGSVSSVNSQVSGSLYINGLLESSLYKNATAGIWSAWFNTTANQNYSAAQSHIARQIYKATLTQTLSSSPTSPFTYDGSAPTITDTLSGTLVSGQSGLSFALGNDSLSTGSTGSSTLSSSSFTFSALGGKYASAGPYSYTSTSSGDQNYTIMNSPPLTITISKATPAMSLLSAPGNFTYNGTEDAFTGAVTSVDDQLSGELYVNGTLKTGPYSTATVGVYKAVFNTSGNRNYSAASSKVSVSILLAVPALLCASKPGNFIENGTQENLTCKIDTVDNQLAADLYINYSNSLGSRWMKYINQTNNDISYYNSSWGGYTAIFNTSGDQNYTGFSVNRSSVIRLERAIITVTPPPTSQPTNNTLNSSSSAANNSHLAGTNPSGVNTQKVLTNRTNLNETNFGDHIVEVYLNTSVQNDAVTLDLSKVVPSSNFYIPITGSGVGVTGLIGISMDENINTSNVKLNVTKVSDATCFGGNLPAPVSFVNITTPFNESKISQVIYYFEVSKQQLAAANLSASEISRYRCNPETHEWQELPTYFVSQNSTTVIYKAISPSFSLYGSAKGQTIMPQNTSSANSHKKNATSGKQAQLVEVQSLIPTKASDPGFLFSFMAIGAIALPLLSMVVYRKICTVR